MSATRQLSPTTAAFKDDTDEATTATADVDLSPILIIIPPGEMDIGQ